MTERTLRKILKERGYEYVEETEAATTGTVGVYAGYTNVIIYAKKKGKKKIRLGVKNLILSSSPSFFRKNNAYKKLEAKK